jgi:hypothetical protein
MGLAHRDADEMTAQQTVVERWRGGKVQSIRFYGDFDPASVG